jgi:pterin-4a-carbinolamine dehydratase
MQYEEIVHDVAHRTGGEAALAAKAVDATMSALVGCLQTDVRAAFGTLLPGRLRASSGKSSTSDTAPDSVRALVWRVAQLLHRPAEQAQFLAHTVLVALREREPQLSRALRLEQDVDRFATATESGGGGIGPFNHSVPLFGPDVTVALRHMPNWSGNERQLVRRVTAAGHSVDIALMQVQQLAARLGRAVDIVRVDDHIADIRISSGEVQGVTALDLDLARQIEAAVMQPRLVNTR